MKISFLKYVLAVCFFVFILSSCEEDEPTGFTTDAPTPTVTSVEPETLLMLETATITGTSFHPDPTQNIIRLGYDPLFGYVTTRPYAGSGNTLEFYFPKVLGDSIPYIASKLSVTRTDAAYYSNEAVITMQVKVPPLWPVFRDDFSQPGGMAFDEEDNLYVADRYDAVIYKITPEGEKSEWGALDPFDNAGELVFGPDGWLYFGAGYGGSGDPSVGVNRLLKFPPEGGDFVVMDNLSDDFRPYGLDFDDAGNLYVTGNHGSYLWRITPDGEGKVLTEVPHGLSVKVFDGYVYWNVRGVGGEPGEGPNQILRAPITAEGIGGIETVFDDPDWTGAYLLGAGAIELDVDGNVYAISSYWDNGNLCKFTPTDDGYEAEVLVEMVPAMGRMAFNGGFLYISTRDESGRIFKVDLGVEGAR